ncbi:hypothetical protein, partial [Streptomyces hygroscopicus]|uniref:hypothetical protein n=1 Tax=Streptomyces hygroscopicus TaxID=1912 RepID=UPI003F1D23D3
YITPTPIEAPPPEKCRFLTILERRSCMAFKEKSCSPVPKTIFRRIFVIFDNIFNTSHNNTNNTTQKQQSTITKINKKTKQSQQTNQLKNKQNKIKTTLQTFPCYNNNKHTTKKTT